ncbi:MAG: hypothetical protein FWE53_02395 [Firmicutes bacterium]|nr:hypothetical protein [Bacillota bacterium]
MRIEKEEVKSIFETETFESYYLISFKFNYYWYNKQGACTTTNLNLVLLNDCVSKLKEKFKDCELRAWLYNTDRHDWFGKIFIAFKAKENASKNIELLKQHIKNAEIKELSSAEDYLTAFENDQKQFKLCDNIPREDLLLTKNRYLLKCTKYDSKNRVVETWFEEHEKKISIFDLLNE